MLWTLHKQAPYLFTNQNGMKIANWKHLGIFILQKPETKI